MSRFKHGDRVRFTAPAVAVFKQWREMVGTVMESEITFGEIVTVLWDDGPITNEGVVVLEREWEL